MRTLDLFSGTGGASKAFLDRGHDVTRVDNDPRFTDVPHTIIGDVLDTFDVKPGAFDVVWASPPCQAFSLAATGTHMTAFCVCRDCGVILQKRHERWEGCEHARPKKDSLWLRLHPEGSDHSMSVRRESSEAHKPLGEMA